MVYMAAEDSWLIEKWVKTYAKGKVLDMGTGSGVQAITASKNAKKVVAVDIDEGSLNYARNELGRAGIQNIELRKSDLFSDIKKTEKFDLIIFNAPYLPEDKMDGGIDTTGGPEGHEIILKFLSNARSHLLKTGVILLLFSSLTNREHLIEILYSLKYKFKELEKQHVAFEDLYVYEVRP